MVNSSQDAIVEEREELMVSPTSGYPTLRIAHFLKPSVTSIDGPVFNLPSNSLLAPNSEPKKRPLKVTFNAWKYPRRNWKTWVNRMHSLYQSVWKQAGIHDAVLNSTYTIKRDDNLFLGFAERWCCDTKTFVFPWGEASITLEDMMILGGYSVLGDSVSVLMPLENREMEIEEKLIQARVEIIKSKAQKPLQSPWMAKFINSGSEIEHEAFLALWLSRFVFPFQRNTTIGKQLFPISIRLARGIKVAIAPAVLANIYRDLSFMKENIVASNKSRTSECDVAVSAPLQFVQIWVWERFPTLRPKPNSLENGEPRFARWHKLKKTGIENLRLAMDSASEYFHWRPYTIVANNLLSFKFYREKEEWVLVGSGLDEELESFVRCLRAAELVGLECIEQYLPHRVAMQFGMDQDLPGHVARANKTPQVAWTNYTRPFGDAKLYIPSRLFESDVTTRYLEWWKRSYGGEEATKAVGKKKRRCKSLKALLEDNSNGKMAENDASARVSCGFPPKRCRVRVGDYADEDKLTLAEIARNVRPRNGKPSKAAAPLPSPLSSNTGNDTVQEAPVDLVENIVESEAAVIEELVESAGDTSESRAESVMVHNMVSMVSKKEENISLHKRETHGLELEARIRKLEKLVDRLKTEKLRRRFG